MQKRRAIQHLLNPRSPADALASYYAVYHPEDRTSLVIQRNAQNRVVGLLTLSRTGMDLFRPLLTMRLAADEPIETAAELLTSSLPPEVAVIVAVPLALRPAIEAFFTVSGETTTTIYGLQRASFQPIINVLVTRAPTPAGDPRFVIRGQSFDRGASPVGPTLAAAGVNWRSPPLPISMSKLIPRRAGAALERASSRPSATGCWSRMSLRSTRFPTRTRHPSSSPTDWDTAARANACSYVTGSDAPLLISIKIW